MIYRVSVDEYDRMCAAGALHDPRVELIHGLLVRKTRKSPAHVIAAALLRQALHAILPPGWHIAKEDPVRIPDYDEPEPDLAVIAGALEDYTTTHPGPADIAFLVEVAESSVTHDRQDKLPAYAAGGIATSWIVNLLDRQIEVYSQPTAEGYDNRQDFAPGQHVPVIIGGIEQGRIAVSDFFP
jgi:Uma2 family endonuclease